MSVPRPSTHPAEQWRRAVDALTQQAADVLYLMAQLDPDEQYRADAVLASLLMEIADRSERIVAGLDPGIARPVTTVDTRGRL